MTEGKDIAGEARREWLAATLYAVRGHFRTESPVAQGDLRPLPSGEEGIVFHCADGRVDEKSDLGLARGQYYDIGKLGVAIAPAGKRTNLEMTAALRRVLPGHDDRGASFPKAILIIGHENCGANDTLLKAELDPRAKPEKPEETKLMLTMASSGLGRALRGAKELGHDALHDTVIRHTVMQSMKNIHGYKAGDVPLGLLMERGQLQVVGAVRGFKPQEDGRYPLSVYDPAHKDFVPVETLYDEAFPGNNRRTADAIVGRMQQLSRERVRTFAPDAAVQYCAQRYIGGIESGLAAQLDRLNRAGQQKATVIS